MHDLLTGQGTLNPYDPGLPVIYPWLIRRERTSFLSQGSNNNNKDDN